jgi:predicted outer membrane repeat protein
MKNFANSRLASHQRRATTPRAATRPRRPHLNVEALEDRLVLSTYIVTTLADAGPPPGTMSLRQAIIAANNDHNTDPNNPDIISIPLTGTIALQSPLPALTGSVAIDGPGASGLTVQGDGAKEFVLNLALSASASVSGLTLEGRFSNGGISVSKGASLTVQDVTIQDAVAGSSVAGGIFNNGGNVGLTRARLLNNIGEGGGGIDNRGGNLTVSQSTFSGNRSLGGGGAINNTDGGVLLVLDSTFVNNSAVGPQGGGAFDVVESTATAVDSTFVGNTSVEFGGAIIVNIGGQLTLLGSTLTGNSATAAGGVTAGGVAQEGSSTIVLRNSIVAGNFMVAGNGTKTPSDVGATIDPSSAFNLIGDGTGLTLPNGMNPVVPLADNFNGSLVGTDAQPIDPRLGPLQDNGGPTFTVALLPGSPALDHGSPDKAADLLSPTNQRGKARVVPQSFLVTPVGSDGRDIGAFELEAQTTPTTLVVNGTADANPPAGVLTLRQALAAANGTVPLASLPAGQVTPGSPYFTAIQFSVTGSIALASALPAITQNAMLEGPGASSLTLTGDGVLGDPMLNVAPGASATVAGLTLDGKGRNEGITVAPHGSLLVQNSVLENCVGAGRGGAISDQVAAVTVRATQLLNNMADFGGGIRNSGGSLSVLQSTFAGNLAPSSGGGIFDGTDANGSGVLTVQDSTFASNSTGLNGGAIYLTSDFPTITVNPYQGPGAQATIGNSTFVGNLAGQIGSAIAAVNSLSLTVTNSTLTQNLAGAAGALYSVISPPVRLVDTIVAGNVLADAHNKPTTVASDVAGLALDPASAYNLIGTGGSGGLQNTNGNQVGVANPGLGTLGDNGGPTQTVALLPGSPAIDAGDPNFTAPPNFDQRGPGFVRVVHGRVDIGAFEVQNPPPVVNPGGPYSINEGDTLKLNGDGTNDPDGDTLSFSWTINGVANAATGVVPSLTYAHLQALGIDDRAAPFTVSLTVDDGHGNVVTASTTLTVHDVPVTVSAGGDTLLAQGGTLGRTGSFTDAAFDGPFSATVDYGAGGGAQTLALNADQTFSLSHAYAKAGQYTVTVAVTDKDGTKGQASFVVTVVAPPAVAKFVVNNGNVQRSMVNSLTVTFSTPVTADAGAFEVTRKGGGDVGLVVTPSADHKSFVLTFMGPGIIGGSLADGRYTLTVHREHVHETSGLGLAMKADATEQFFRLFGDSNGDGRVNAYDLAFFRSTYLKHRGEAGYLWWLDYDQNGTVDKKDYAQFVLRYGRRV